MMAESGLVVNLVSVLIGAALGAWFAYRIGRLHGVRRGAELASRNIAAPQACSVRRVRFTSYLNAEPVLVHPDFVKLVVTAENDATHLVFANGTSLTVAERICDVQRALGVRQIDGEDRCGG